MAWLLLFPLFLSILSLVQCDQLFTDGISIIDAPSSGSPAHAGSTLPIAVDVSGNGQLTPDAANPNSTSPTHLSLLEIYLVSAETNINITVTSGTTFLTNETGTVRHLNWLVPTCVPAGQYNLTFYETSVVNGENHFIITPVSVPVQNTNPTSPCTQNVNPLQPQPQPATPLSQSPFLGSNGVITITISGSNFQFPTITETVSPSVTMVIVSMATTTITEQNDVATSIVTETFTTTVSSSGFIPVNAVNAATPKSCWHGLLYWYFALCVFILYL